MLVPLCVQLKHQIPVVPMHILMMGPAIALLIPHLMSYWKIFPILSGPLNLVIRVILVIIGMLFLETTVFVTYHITHVQLVPRWCHHIAVGALRPLAVKEEQLHIHGTLMVVAVPPHQHMNIVVRRVTMAMAQHAPHARHRGNRLRVQHPRPVVVFPPASPPPMNMVPINIHHHVVGRKWQ